MTATQRCRTWAVTMSPASGGATEPFMSGQSGNTSAAFRAVTCEPKRSSAKVVAAANAASRVKRWLDPRPPMRAGNHDRARTNTRSATSAIAVARCAVTDSPVLPSRTVSRPSQA